MVLGACLYVTYTLFAAFNWKWTIVISSILVGFAASILWTSQGDYITKIAGKNMGLFSGVFFGLFFISLIFGNILVSTLLTFGLPTYVTFLILFGIGVLGVFILCFLRRAPEIENKEVNVEKDDQIEKQMIQENISLFASIKNSAAIIFETKMFLILGLCTYSGYSNAFFSGKIPEIFGQYSQNIVGYAMSCYGIAEVIGSVIFGKSSDYFGKKPIIYITIFCHYIAIGFTFFMLYYPPYLFFVSAFLNGFADSGMNTNIYAILGSLYSDRASDAFACFKLIQSLAYAFGYLISIYAPFLALQIFAFFFISAALLMFLILDSSEQI